MRIFHDWEFLEDGHTIDWISVGAVREDGEELYLVNADMNATRIAGHPWLMANVVPHLPLLDLGRSDEFALDRSHPAVVEEEEAAEQLRRFITDPLIVRESPELWAWYGAYDHVRLAQMWGAMINLPRGVPMVTHDIMTLRLLAGTKAQMSQPSQQGDVHHALADAHHNQRLYDHYMTALLDRLDRKMED